MPDVFSSCILNSYFQSYFQYNYILGGVGRRRRKWYGSRLRFMSEMGGASVYLLPSWCKNPSVNLSQRSEEHADFELRNRQGKCSLFDSMIYSCALCEICQTSCEKQHLVKSRKCCRFSPKHHRWMREQQRRQLELLLLIFSWKLQFYLACSLWKNLGLRPHFYDAFNI